MLNVTPLQQKVIEEIQHLPDEKLRKIYDVIHFFRVGVESARSPSHKTIMAFAGCWDDMPDHEFNALLRETQERRSRAFSGRTHRETLID